MNNRNSINSSRLSVALLDLPLTPFGMKSPRVNKNILQSTRNDYIKTKTSKLRLKSVQEIENLSDSEEKENYKFLDNMKNVNLGRNRRKRQQQRDNDKGKLFYTQNESPIRPEIAYTIDSTSDGRSNRRESIFTDIDEGSFIEFTGAPVPAKPARKEAVNVFYYTCSEDNETKYSTSSKEPSSPVGFQKYVDKLRNADKMKCIAEEGSFSQKNRDFNNQNIDLDETVITGSRDFMYKRNNKFCENVVMNSTVNNPKSKVIPIFPDISTLTLNKFDTSDCSNPNSNLCTNKPIEFILLSESDDDDDQHIKEKEKYKISSHDIESQHKYVPVREKEPIKFNAESSLISEDISLASTVIIPKDNNKPLTLKSKSPSKNNDKNSPALKFKSPVNVRGSYICNFDNNECEEKNNSFEVDDRLVGWILHSPFKDSSFGTSFINKNEISPNKKGNAGISSQSLDLRLSDDFSPGKSSGKTVFTLGRVPESPDIEDVLCNVRKIIPNSTTHNNDENPDDNEENVNKVCNFMSEEHLNRSETDFSQNSFKTEKIKISESTPSNLINRNLNSYFEAAEKSFSLNLGENDENSSLSYEVMRKEYRKKSLSLDGINRLAHISDEEYPSAGELYDSFNSREELFKDKHGLHLSHSKSDGELNISNDKEYQFAEKSNNSFVSEKKERKAKVETNIYPSNSDKLNSLNNSEELQILETSSDTDSDNEKVKSSFLNNKARKKATFVLESSDDSLPDIPNQDKSTHLFDDLISSLNGKLNITKAKQPKSKLFSNPINIRENSLKDEKSAPSNESFNISSSSNSESSDSFENYIRSVKKSTKENTHKSTKSPINDSDFIVSDSEDVLYISPSSRNITKKLIDHNTYPNIKEYKTNDNNWRKPPKLIISSSSESEEDNLPTKDRKVILKPKNLKKKKISSKIISTVEVEKNKTCRSFLSSLTQDTPISEAHVDALPFIKNFKKLKESLTTKLYDLFNASIFDNQLPSSMNIRWNPRLRKTAGYCYQQIDKSKPRGRGSRIELSSKVIDAPGRLRDTLIHELCHAASWIISGYKDGHGPIWKSWASKAQRVFPELPLISRCHSYKINCKYTYKCMNCGYSIGRHSKSLDTTKKVCGYCHGKFELIVNYQGKGPSSSSNHIDSQKTMPKTPRTPNKFALYVKANYGSAKKSRANLKHKDVMKILSEDFAKMKTSEILLL